MNSSNYFNYIEEKLSILATRIDLRGRLNLLDLNIHSENFYLRFFNLLFGWELINQNAIQQNAEAVDLVDTKNKIVIQVSSTSTKQKIESALNKKGLNNYKDYSFKFISISKDAENLRKKNYLNPHNLVFSPTTDIYDVSSVLNFILGLDIEKQKSIYDFLKKELKNEPDPEKIETNLATIIQILSKEDWSQEVLGFETVPYDLEAKISYNHLDKARDFIDDYKIHYHRVDKIYSDFNKQGVNKSISILNGIHSEYNALDTESTADQCFLSIIKRVIQRVQASANYTPIPFEELELCVQILVVDAFIRCKIFKNPTGSEHAGS
jgi:hypothetical protein